MKNSSRDGLPTAPSRALYYVLALGFFLRILLPVLGYAHAHDSQIFLNPDTATYVAPTHELLADHRFYSDGHPEIIRTPGYPLLLTVGLALHHLTAITIFLQVLLSTLTIYLVYASANVVFESEHAALAAAALYAVEPLSILYSSQLLTETLFTALSTLGVYEFLKYLRCFRLRHLIAAAVVLAASVYVRPIGYFLPIFLAVGLLVVAFFYQRRKTMQVVYAALFALIALALLLPWQLRNNAEAGYRGFAGISAVNMYFYLAASVLAVQRHTPFFEEQHQLGYLNDHIYFADHPEQRDWPLAARLTFIDGEARRILAANKAVYLRIHFSGVARALLDSGATDFLIFFRLYQRGGGLLGSFDDKGLLAGFQTLVRTKPAVFWSNTLLFPFELLYLVGAVIVLFTKRITQPPVAATFSVAAYYLIVAGGPAALGRFKHPAMPAISILAGFGIITGLAWLRNNSSRATEVPSNEPAANYNIPNGLEELTRNL